MNNALTLTCTRRRPLKSLLQIYESHLVFLKRKENYETHTRTKHALLIQNEKEFFDSKLFAVVIKTTKPIKFYIPRKLNTLTRIMTCLFEHNWLENGLSEILNLFRSYLEIYIVIFPREICDISFLELLEIFCKSITPH